MTEKNKKLLRLGLSAMVFIFLVLLYGYFHTKIYISSDTTTTYPMALDILDGNIWLKGWILGTNNFYFTETMLFAFGHLLGVSSRVILQFLPGAAWALTAVLILYYLNIWEEKNRTKMTVFVMMFIAFLILIPTSSGYTLLNANSHNNLYAFEMVWLILLKRYIDHEDRWLPFVLALFAGIMYFSESVALMTLFAPVGCICVYQIVFRKNRKWGIVLVSLMAGFLIGKGIYVLFGAMGGMDTRGLPVGIVRDGFVVRLREWINQFGVLMGIADLSTAAASPYVVFVRVMIAVFAVSLIVNAVRFVRLSWEKQLLYAIVIVNFAASEVTNVVIFHRYIVPGWYFGWILCIMMIAEVIAAIDSRSARRIAVVLIGTACCWSGYKKVSQFVDAPEEGTAQKELAEFMKEKNLGTGYGDFWLASSSSFFTDFDIDIYPVRISENSDSIVAYEELIRKDWYSEKNVHYILSYADPSSSLFINYDAMIAICGEPDTVYTVGPYAIYYWDKDISAYMNNGFYDGIVSASEMTENDGAVEENGMMILSPESYISGPGTIITKGNYNVTISGEHLENMEVTAYSAAAESEYELEPVALEDQEIRFSISLKKDLSDLCFRITNTSEETAEFRQLCIQEG